MAGISVKPNIARLDGDAVHFIDGSRAPFDAIHLTRPAIAPASPSLAREVFDPDAESGRLYRRMLPLGHNGLIFAGACATDRPDDPPRRDPGAVDREGSSAVA